MYREVKYAHNQVLVYLLIYFLNYLTKRGVVQMQARGAARQFFYREGAWTTILYPSNKNRVQLEERISVILIGRLQ